MHVVRRNHKQLDGLGLEENCEVIIGGDFNVILEPDLDGTGGKPQVKDSCKRIDNLCSLFDLIDINFGELETLTQCALHGDKKIQ